MGIGAQAPIAAAQNLEGRCRSPWASGADDSPPATSPSATSPPSSPAAPPSPSPPPSPATSGAAASPPGAAPSSPASASAGAASSCAGSATEIAPAWSEAACYEPRLRRVHASARAAGGLGVGTKCGGLAESWLRVSRQGKPFGFDCLPSSTCSAAAGASASPSSAGGASASGSSPIFPNGSVNISGFRLGSFDSYGFRGRTLRPREDKQDEDSKLHSQARCCRHRHGANFELFSSPLERL